jgi:hypothetical protein
MRNLIYRDPDLGNIYTPPGFWRSKSYPGQPTRRIKPGEVGIFVAVQKRPIYRDDGFLERMETLWWSITHNERVDAGADKQARQTFGAGASPAAPSATVYFSVMAIANATLTKAKGDQSLGSTSSGVTTNEFTTLGLARVAATTPVGGDYTAPASLGAQFAQILRKTFTATGSATALGGGLFDSTTVAGSILYAEDNYASSAVLVTNDTLTQTITVNN